MTQKVRFRGVAAVMVAAASLSMGVHAAAPAGVRIMLAAGEATGALAGDAAMTRVRKALPLAAETVSAHAMPPVPGEGEQAVYAFFPDVAYTVTVTRVEAVFGGTLLVHGSCGAEGDARFSSTLAPDGFLHEVHDFKRGMLYQASGRADGGSLEIREYEDAKRLRVWDEPAATFSAGAEGADPNVTKMTAAAAPAASAATVIDVMLVFDTTAQTWVNANGGATAFANAAVAKMNAALANSGVDCTYRLVYVMSAGYTHSGAYSTDLNALRAGAGSLSAVTEARNTYGADLVSMMVDTGSAYGSTGLGDMPVKTAGWVMGAFSVCSIRSVSISHTLTHEIGHNLGCGHSKYQADTPGPSKVFTYAAGWYFTGKNGVRYNTIMAYETDGTYFGYTPCDYFSTPLKTVQGVAVGHSADGDNARCISNMKAVIAAYRTATIPGLTVTFDAQGGTAAVPASATVTNGLTYGTLAATARAGYTFSGWWTGVGGTGTQVTSGTTVTTANTHTLYATWTISPLADRFATAGVAFDSPLPETYAGAATVTVAGLPAGLRYSAATRHIAGVPTEAGVFTVRFSSKGLPTLTLRLTVLALPAWAQGVFNGTVSVDGERKGLASMNATAAGRITGKLSFGGTNYGFSAASYSRRAADSDATSVIYFTAAPKAGKVALLPIEFAVWSWAMSCGGCDIPESLGGVDGTGEYTGMPIAATLYRNVWNDVGMAATLSPFIGYYTATLPGNDEYGSGYLTFTVDKAGKVKTAGKLADGTAVSLAGTLILDETGRVFAGVYTAPTAYKGGCLYGLAEFVDPFAGEVYLRLLDDMPFTWSSRSLHATATYGDGFIREADLVGGWYDTIGNLNDYYQNKNLTAGVDAGASTPVLTVGTTRYDSVRWEPTGIILTPTLKSGMMAGLSAPPAGKPLDPDKDGIWDYGAANSVGLKISLTRATGVFKGSFLAWFDYPVKRHVSKSVSYEGVLTLERENPADGVAGRGYFLWPDRAVPPLPAKPYGFNWSYDFRILMD